MIGWKEFFDLQVNDANEAIQGSIQNIDKLIKSVAVLSIHVALFLFGSWFIFRKKDILS